MQLKAAPPLGEAVYRRLRDDIVTCRLAPGQLLTERRLATATGFSPSSIREALTRLDQEGLIRTIPRKGYQVKPLTIKAIDDLFEFWQVIGPELARRGLSTGTPEQIADITAGFEAIARLNSEAGQTRDNIARMGELGSLTFGLLAAGTHNQYLIGTYQRLSDELGRVWALIMTGEAVGPLPSGLPDNWRDMLEKRDGEAFAEFALRYIGQLGDHVQQTLMRWPSVVATEVLPLVPRGDD